jgi:hypothetical protein
MFYVPKRGEQVLDDEQGSLQKAVVLVLWNVEGVPVPENGQVEQTGALFRDVVQASQQHVRLFTSIETQYFQLGEIE